MLGLFGKKKEPETLLQKEKDRYGGSGFDPTGLERAAKAAREIDASAHARLAFDVIQAREATKRLEHGTRQAAYEMRAREYEMQSVGKEGAEARQTLAAQTDHANRQAEFADQLERRRYAANLGAQRDARAAELQRHEASLARQEELRRRTLRYEAELREKTELKRAEAEATARARAERETHDLSLARMRAEAAERRETLLRSIGVSFETAGAGLRAFLGDREQMARAVGIASALALGVHYYIKYVALRQIAWGTSNLDTIAVPPPRPGAEQRHIVSAEWRYAWNVCTHGYTMPWWGWQRWELELVSAGPHRTIPHHSAPASWDGSRTHPAPPDWCDLRHAQQARRGPIAVGVLS